MKKGLGYLAGSACIGVMMFVLFVSPALAGHQRGCGHTAPGIDCGSETYCGEGCRADGYMAGLASSGTNQTFNCASCSVVCSSGFFDCTAVAGCETADRRGVYCETAGLPGIYADACGTTCAADARPAVTLDPYSAQGANWDDEAGAAIWINGTSDGHLLRLQTTGTDRVVITNSGQLVLGLDVEGVGAWTTITQTVGLGQNLIYGGITSSSVGNVLNFERAGTPNLSLLRLDASGNLTLGGRVSAPEVCLAGSCRTTWPATGGLTTTAPATAGTLARFVSAAGSPLTLTNSIISEASGTIPSVSVAGDITATGCFGPTFVGVTSFSVNGSQGGYLEVRDICDGAFDGSHVCTTEAILDSIRCDNADIVGASGLAWINNGPPGYLSPSNDCQGWTNAGPTAYGTIWEFGVTGGNGSLTTCETTRVFACCS